MTFYRSIRAACLSLWRLYAEANFDRRVRVPGFRSGVTAWNGKPDDTFWAAWQTRWFSVLIHWRLA